MARQGKKNWLRKWLFFALWLAVLCEKQHKPVLAGKVYCKSIGTGLVYMVYNWITVSVITAMTENCKPRNAGVFYKR